MGLSVPQRPSPTSKKLQHILHHAARVFSAKGYEGASLRDISRASGVALSGIYYYVESKQELLYLIQYQIFRTVLDRLEERVKGVSDARERLRILVRNHVEFFLSHPAEMKVLTREGEALEETCRDIVAGMKREYYGRALGIFQELRKSGAVREIEPRLAVLSLFGMMNWIHTWHRPAADPPAGALADVITDIFLHGVLSGPAASKTKGTSPGREDAEVAARATG